jgi:hypothetical protein
MLKGGHASPAIAPALSFSGKENFEDRFSESEK